MELQMTAHDPLATVRSAHRYVAAYTRRVLDAAAAFGQAVGELGFNYEGGDPLFYKFPRPKFVFTSWAWDFLPMYSVRLGWSRNGINANVADNAVVLLDHIADTGFESRTSGKLEPDPLKDLPPAEASD